VTRQPAIDFEDDGRVRVTLNNVNNWYLRFLGVYIQFLDANDKVIPASELPRDTLPDRDSPLSPTLDRENALFAGIIPPVYSVAGVPIYPPGQISVIVKVPTAAATMNIFYAGAGGSGSVIGPAGIIHVGVAMTSAVCYGLVAIFMAVGVSTFSVVFKQIFGTVGQGIAAELVSCPV
jgi:hypothetical protein